MTTFYHTNPCLLSHTMLLLIRLNNIKNRPTLIPSHSLPTCPLKPKSFKRERDCITCHTFGLIFHYYLSLFSSFFLLLSSFSPSYSTHTHNTTRTLPFHLCFILRAALDPPILIFSSGFWVSFVYCSC